MLNPINPYIADKPVYDSAAFIGRSDIVREVIRMLHHDEDNAIVLYGQRHIGKTSALQHLKVHLLTQGNYCPIYVDLQGKASWTVGQVISELANSIAHTLEQAEPDLGEQPEITFIDTWLPNVLQSLPENRALVLLFDEFEVLADPKIEQAAMALFPYLRQLLDRDPKHLNFVFAMGRNVDDIDHIAVSLFRGIPPIKRLSLFNQADTTTLVRLAEANNSLNWPDEAVECVWRYTQGHPFLTQQVCFHVWEQAYEVNPATMPTISPTDVENVIFDVLDASRKPLTWLWNGLPPAERVVASALASAGQQSHTEQALEKWLYENGIRVFIRELQNAPCLLQEWDWLESANGGYRFRVELLRRWIMENKPLRRIQDELDRIEPVADSFFRTAQDLYQAGDLDSAIKQLREAIGLNPNHLGAHQLLADILLAQGQAGEARVLLEKLYNYQPLAARSRLIQSLLVLAQQTNREKQQLKLYEQVLALEPKQPEATAKRKEIWLQHGERAQAKEDFKTALDVYKQLGLHQKIAETEQKIRDRYFDLITEFDLFKKKRNYLVGLLIILALVSGVLVYWSQHVQWVSQQQLEKANWKNGYLEKTLEDANETNTRLAKALEQAKGENVHLKTTLEHTGGKQAHLEIALKQANQQVLQLKNELARLSQKTELGKFMSQLETGDQIVIVGSYRNPLDADKKLKKLKAKYPELFYPQFDLLSDNRVKDNIYQHDNLWEIFISGFYSYNSANALKTKVLEFKLVEDAFIRKDPFR